MDLIYPQPTQIKYENIVSSRDINPPATTVQYNISSVFPTKYQNFTIRNFCVTNIYLTTTGAVSANTNGFYLDYNKATGVIKISTRGDSMKISRISLVAVYV